MYHIRMKDQTTPEQTEFDFNESGETEQQRLEREVLAAGGRVGKSEGRFIFGLGESEGYKRGDEHRDIRGLYFYGRNKQKGASAWLNGNGLMIVAKKDAVRKDVWQKSNKLTVNERNRLWKASNKEQVKESGRLYRLNNKEKERVRQRGWCKSNPEKVKEKSRRHYKANARRQIEKVAMWRKENPERVRANNARYRARKLEALDPSASKAIIYSRYEAQAYLKEVTGCDWHVDHTKPLSRGGKENEDNLQVVPARWNERKGSHHCDRWIEDSDIYRYATAVEARFEREAKKNEKK